MANLATLNVIFRSPTASCAGHHRIDCVATNATPPITPGWKRRQRYRSSEITPPHRREAHRTNKNAIWLLGWAMYSKEPDNVDTQFKARLEREA